MFVHSFLLQMKAVIFVESILLLCLLLGGDACPPPQNRPNGQPRKILAGFRRIVKQGSVCEDFLSAPQEYKEVCSKEAMGQLVADFLEASREIDRIGAERVCRNDRPAHFNNTCEILHFACTHRNLHRLRVCMGSNASDSRGSNQQTRDPEGLTQQEVIQPGQDQARRNQKNSKAPREEADDEAGRDRSGGSQTDRRGVGRGLSVGISFHHQGQHQPVDNDSGQNKTGPIHPPRNQPGNRQFGSNQQRRDHLGGGRQGHSQPEHSQQDPNQTPRNGASHNQSRPHRRQRNQIGGQSQHRERNQPLRNLLERSQGHREGSRRGKNKAGAGVTTSPEV
ncbi:uncharacterized protein [Diadema setosum]|uniref:uncharacterized protein n=1 Tax=Diadema setosum TaxID=31175 RepID=UPI003B3AFB97